MSTLNSSGSRTDQSDKATHTNGSKRSGGYEAGQKLVSDLPNPPSDPGIGSSEKADRVFDKEDSHDKA